MEKKTNKVKLDIEQIVEKSHKILFLDGKEDK